MKQMVFICGCSRSGTTSFADWLNAHGKIAMGRERYGKRLRLDGRLPPDLFEKDRFCRDLRPDDSHHRKLQPIYAEIAERFEDFTHIGDKIPNLFLHFDAIAADYPNAKIIFMLRDIHAVANSHEGRRQIALKHEKAKWPLWRDAKNAVKEWNAGIAAVEALEDQLECLIVDYGRLYVDEKLIGDVTSFLNLNETQSFRNFWSEAAGARQAIDAKPRKNLTPEDLAYIEKEADMAGYRRLLDRV